mgnify:CR=1 FL=1
MSINHQNLNSGAIPSRWVDWMRNLNFILITGFAYSVLFYVLYLMAAALDPNLGIIDWVKNSHDFLVPVLLCLIVLIQVIILGLFIDLRTRVKRIES